MSHIFAAATADFKERSRRFSFWAMVALCLFAAFLFIPNPTASFRVLVLDSHIYAQASNPTWIPMASALCTGLLLPLLGFAFVKNAIGGDRENGVLSLLQSTRLPRVGYVAGKFLSNCGILLAWLGVLVLGAVVMATVRFPGQWLSPWALFSPFLALVPGLVFTAALAVFCETVPFLRSKAGSVFAILGIFILQVTSIVQVMDGLHSGSWSLIDLLDIAGYRMLFGAIHMASIAATGSPVSNSTILGGGDWIEDTGKIELVFKGISPSPVDFTGTVTLLLLSILLVLAAALLLERRPLASRHKKRYATATPDAKEAVSAWAPLPTAQWTPTPTGRYSPVRIVAVEAHRLAKSVSLLWLIPAAGLMVAICLAPVDIGASILLPVLYGWAIFPFSAMGSEEEASGMDALYRTVSGAPVRQAAAAYAAGAIFSLLLAAPVAARLLLAGYGPTTAAVLIWALMVPAVGIVLGSLSRGPRPFQILSIVVLYMALNMPDTFFPMGAGALFSAGVYLVCTAAALALLFAERLRAER